MKELIKEILELAINASSGHNSQPWKFVVKNESVFVWNIPDKDKILFNYKQRGSFIAHGALIENIVIIASKMGYKADVILFPQQQEPNLIAEVNFKKATDNYLYEDLYPNIIRRTTNRKPYKKIPLKDTDKESFEIFSKSLKDGRFEIIFTQDNKSIKQAAESFSVGDRLIFENFHVHSALFSNVNWTLKEEQKKREGLYVGTKELSFFARLLFKYVLSNWNIINKLGVIKFSEKAAQKRQKLYEQCLGIGVIVAPDDSPKSFVESGRFLQRLWLKTTSSGLSFQPVSVGLLYLGQWIQREIPKELTKKQVELIKGAYNKIMSVFNISEKIPTFSFRIGYSEPPTASSLKKPPEITYN